MKRQVQVIGMAIALSAGTPGGAQRMGPVDPQAGGDPDCVASVDPETITVCHRRDRGDRYRVPEELRGSGQIDSHNMARAALDRDSRARAQYSAQTVGPFGAAQRSRQVRCEWIAERQVAQGRQIDCTKKARGDRAGDWKGDRR